MNESEMELNVGDTILVGDRLLTVVDVEGDDVVFRIEDISSHESCEPHSEGDFSSEGEFSNGDFSPWMTTGEEMQFPPR